MKQLKQSAKRNLARAEKISGFREESSFNYKYFIHKDCAFYPCHNLQEWESCLFCWCPLFLVDCGGDFIIKDGIKDCLSCKLPHTREGYDYVMGVVRKEIYGL